MKRPLALLLATAGLALAACNKDQAKPLPQGPEIAKDMPDTSASTAAGVAPDASATGVVPADGSPAPRQPDPPPPVNLPPATAK